MCKWTFSLLVIGDGFGHFGRHVGSQIARLTEHLTIINTNGAVTRTVYLIIHYETEVFSGPVSKYALPMNVITREIYSSLKVNFHINIMFSVQVFNYM